MADVMAHDVPAVLAAVREVAEERVAPAACAASRQLDRARAEGRKALTTARATQSATAARELRQIHDLLRA